jgi:hypothetical protein
VAEEERIRVELGFDGGQVLSTLATPASVDELERELGKGDGVVTLDAADGRFLVALGKVVYVKRHARESRVGFGG